jgi:O-antigen biosynthesis protein WbqL
MATTLDVTHSSRVSLKKGLVTSEPYCRVLQHKGGQAFERRPLMWPTPLDLPELVEQHDPARPPMVSSDVHVHFVKDVLVGGYGGHLLKDGRYLVNQDSYPFYVANWIENDLSRSHWAVEPKTVTRVLEPVYVISHFNPIYGHWLLEILPKLFSIADLVRKGVVRPIVVPSWMPKLVSETIALIVPECPILTYDWVSEGLHLRRAILPGMMQHQYVFNRAFHAELDRFLRPFRAEPGPPAIFVSRTGLEGKFRTLDNADALDETAARLGLTVIRPEELAWTEQLRLFASAKLIVGEFGSGLHNALFSPAGTKVVCLNVVTDVQSRIANSFGHDMGILLAADGAPRLFEKHWTVQQSYSIDLRAFEDRIAPLMAALA